jgi:hypothetical protein
VVKPARPTTDHRIEAAREDAIGDAATDQLEPGADGLPAGGTRGMHRTRVAADAEHSQQQRDPGARLAAAEHQRIGRRFVRRQQAIGLEFPAGLLLHLRELAGYAHHAVPTTQPQRSAVPHSVDTSIIQRL